MDQVNVLKLLLSLGVVFLFLLVAQTMWQKKIVKGEVARKFVHIGVGVFGAFWPLYMSWLEIQIIVVLAVCFILAIRWFKIFQSVYDVKRMTWGDIIGPVTIGLIAFFEPPKLIFAVAVLHIALADGLAAVVGSRFGKKNSYKVFENKKSIAGSFTFWATSVLIMSGVVIARPNLGVTELVLLLGIVPLFLTAIENVSPYGSDNIFVPVAVIIVLSLVS